MSGLEPMTSGLQDVSSAAVPQPLLPDPLQRVHASIPGRHQSRHRRRRRPEVKAARSVASAADDRPLPDDAGARVQLHLAGGPLHVDQRQEGVGAAPVRHGGSTGGQPDP